MRLLKFLRKSELSIRSSPRRSLPPMRVLVHRHFKRKRKKRQLKLLSSSVIRHLTKRLRTLQEASKTPMRLIQTQTMHSYARSSR